MKMALAIAAGITVVAGGIYAGAIATGQLGLPGERGPSHSIALSAPVTLPMQLTAGHIFLDVKVNDSRPLSFILDSGDKYGIVDVDLAKELNIPLGMAININGVGAAAAQGAIVNRTSFTLDALPGFAQPITLAMPLRRLAPRFGRDVGGILGADFMSDFVVEIDYEKNVVRLHDKTAFVYSGAGVSVPVQLDGSGHPVFDGVVTPLGGSPVAGRFDLDIGSGASLTLSSPFVREHGLPGAGNDTVPSIGVGGNGGESVGVVGYMASFSVGGLVVNYPVTQFSADTAGAHASTTVQGSIGQRIARRFTLFLDYSRHRIIFEPSAVFSDGSERSTIGAVIESEGADYRTFRVTALLPGAPAAEAGIQIGDVITAIDGRTAATLRLTAVLDILAEGAPHHVEITRNGQAVTLTVTPRVMPALKR